MGARHRGSVRELWDRAVRYRPADRLVERSNRQRHTGRVNRGMGGSGVPDRIGLAQPLVSAVNRDRPYAKHPTSVVLVDKSTDPSFPSDHATVSGAIAGGLWLTRRRIRYVAVGLAFLMAFIRVYVGAHYPGDVIAGLAFGALIGLIGGRYVIPLIRRILDRLRPSSVGRLISTRPIRARGVADGRTHVTRS